MKKAICLAWVVGVVLPVVVWGEDSKYQTFITGDRAGGMGGAAVAIGRGTEVMGVNIGINYLYGEGHDMGYTAHADGNVSEARCRATEEQIFLTFNTSYYF